MDLPAAALPSDGGYNFAGAQGEGGGGGFGGSFGQHAVARTLEAKPAGGGTGGLGLGAHRMGGVLGASSSSASLGCESILSCSWQGEVLWTAALPSAAVLLAGNSAFAVAACGDGAVYLYTSAGRRAAPPLLPCAGGVAALASDVADSLLVVGCHGEVVVYSGLPQQPRCSLRCSAAPLLCQAATASAAAAVADGGGGGASGAGSLGDLQPRLLDAVLLPGGRPMLLMAHGAFSYSPDLQTWVDLGDEAFGLSEHRSSLPPQVSAPPSLTLASLRHSPSLSTLQREHAAASGRVERSAANFASSLAAAPSEHQRLVSIGHLEHQMAASRALGDGNEYREWLRMYAAALGKDLAVRQVRELCDELLGPIHFGDVDALAADVEAADGASPPVPLRWLPTVAGLCKRTLLREVVLPALANNRSLQRVLAEYIEQLAAVSA
jgi:protein HIRA/HIR1